MHSIHKTICVFRVFSQPPEVCCRNLVHAAISPQLADVTGKYFESCKVQKQNSQAHDESSTRFLWNLSMLLTGCTQNGDVIRTVTQPELSDNQQFDLSIRDYMMQTLKPVTSPLKLEIDRTGTKTKSKRIDVSNGFFLPLTGTSWGECHIFIFTKNIYTQISNTNPSTLICDHFWTLLCPWFRILWFVLL